MTRTENQVASNFLKSDIDTYNEIAKSSGLTPFKEIVKEAVSRAKEFSLNEDNIIDDAIEIVEAAIGDFIEED